LGDLKIAADFADQEIVDFRMPGDGTAGSVGGVAPPGMVSSFADEMTLALVQVLDELPALHTASGSSV
jgi:hypothetical protein